MSYFYQLYNCISLKRGRGKKKRRWKVRFTNLCCHKPKDTKYFRQPWEAKRGSLDFFSELPEGTNTANTLILDFWSSELWRRNCYCFKPPSLWWFRKLIQIPRTIWLQIHRTNWVQKILSGLHTFYKILKPAADRTISSSLKRIPKWICHRFLWLSF